LNIYIAALQENYSETLLTPARLKRAVFRWEKNHRWQGFRKNTKFRRGAHSRSRGPPRRICGPALWRYAQMGQGEDPLKDVQHWKNRCHRRNNYRVANSFLLCVWLLH